MLRYSEFLLGHRSAVLPDTGGTARLILGRDSMILIFHVSPLPRGQRLCDIDSL